MDDATTDLVHVARSPSAVPIVARDFAEAMTIAEQLSQSTYLSISARGSMANVLTMIMAGAELGFPPLASLRLWDLNDGRLSLRVYGKEAAVRMRGGLEYLKRIVLTDEEATYEIKRRGEDPVRSTFTYADAVRAKLPDRNPTWKAYPRKMLRARCKSDLLDEVFPDILAGVPTTELLADDEEARHAKFAGPPASSFALNPAAQAAAITAANLAGQGKAKKKKGDPPPDVIDVPPDPPAEPIPQPAATPPPAPPAPAASRSGNAGNEAFPFLPNTTPEDDAAYRAAFQRALESARSLEDLDLVARAYKPWTETPHGQPFENEMRSAYARQKADLVREGLGG